MRPHLVITSQTCEMTQKVCFFFLFSLLQSKRHRLWISAVNIQEYESFSCRLRCGDGACEPADKAAPCCQQCKYWDAEVRLGQGINCVTLWPLQTVQTQARWDRSPWEAWISVSTLIKILQIMLLVVFVILATTVSSLQWALKLTEAAG